MPILEVKNLKAAYEKQVVLDNISFSLERGETLAVIGPNGSGKTTLLRLLLREIKPNQGEIILDGKNIAKLSSKEVPRLRQHIGTIFQDFKVIPERTVAENVEVALAVIGLPKNEWPARTEHVLRLVGLSDRANLFPSQLSGGELQRVRLAGYLSHGMMGTLYVLDEPTTGLHARDIGELSIVLRNLCVLGNTVLVVEQDESIIRESDNVIELGPKSGVFGGNITFNGKVNEYGDYKKAISIKNTKGMEKKVSSIDKINHLIFKSILHRNFKNCTVMIPLNKFVCITGVSGSGKSTLVEDIIYPTLAKVLYNESFKIGKFDSVSGIKHIKEVVLIDQKIPKLRSLDVSYVLGLHKKY